MTGYLLDTSICIFFLRGAYGIAERLRLLDKDKCYISEITIAELTFGAYRSANVEKNLSLIKEFVENVQVVPFSECIDIYSKEKARLWSQGTPVEDFDLLIASAALSRNLVLVTDNVKHFKNIQTLKIENWVERN